MLAGGAGGGGVTTDERRAFVSSLAGKIYAAGGVSATKAVILAHATLEACDVEWSAMSPAQQEARFEEACGNIAARAP